MRKFKLVALREIATDFSDRIYRMNKIRFLKKDARPKPETKF